MKLMPGAEDSFETMAAYLYAANSLGVPTGGALNTLATVTARAPVFFISR
jgi:hypothetical protein